MYCSETPIIRIVSITIEYCYSGIDNFIINVIIINMGAFVVAIYCSF